MTTVSISSDPFYVFYSTTNGDPLSPIKEGELSRDVNVQNLHNIQNGRGRPELVYDLDVMISVGYRVKSI